MNTTVVLEVRKDKEIGILVLTIRAADRDNTFFFRAHHQPLRYHPEQVQEIVKKSNPTARKKSITIDAMDFLRQYWNGNQFEFLGVTLTSTEDQISKVHTRLINKEAGAIKRKDTIEAKKQQKAAEKIQKFQTKLYQDEQKFQADRAKRIAELMVQRKNNGHLVSKVQSSTSTQFMDTANQNN